MKEEDRAREVLQAHAGYEISRWDMQDNCSVLAKHAVRAMLAFATPAPVIETEGSREAVSAAVYEAAVKGRQDFRQAYRELLPIQRAAAALCLLWRSPQHPFQVSDEFADAVNALDVATCGGGKSSTAKPALEALLPARSEPVVDGEPHPVIMIEVESAHDRHTYTFTSRPESEAFLAGARKFPGIAVTAIEERHVATAEYALGGLPEMLEAQVDD